LKKEIKSVDEYILSFEEETQHQLQIIRSIVKKIAPYAIESISYGMPAYKFKGNPLVYFGGYKKHIGFYATAIAHEKFKDQLSIYKHGKGSVQFPNQKPLPIDLIKSMLKFRLSFIK
jgi:uncharacterized protein YdhG (YjbR/CyaY superfamily)